MFKKKSSKKSKLKEPPTNEDNSWIVEGIIAFLRSPTWKVPVLDFVECQCGSFTDDEENSLEHSEIHKEYKKLVEKLLSDYIQELGISETQFSSACSRSNRDIVKLDSRFEFIWAADDFLIFKRLMINCNIDLQKDALKMMTVEYGNHANSKFSDEDAELLTKMLKQSKLTIADRKYAQKKEEEDLKLAIEFSRMEMDRLNMIQEKENSLLEEAIRLSLACSQPADSKTSSNTIPSSAGLGEFNKPSSMVTLTQPVSITAEMPSEFSEKSLEKPPKYHPPSEEIARIHSPALKQSEDHESNKIDVAGATEHHKPSNYHSPSEEIVRIPPPVVEQSEVHESNKIDIAGAIDQHKSNSASKSSSLPPLKSSKDISSAEAANAWLDQAMKGIIDSTNSNHIPQSKSNIGSIDPEELAKRRAYLQEQRDKLLARKREERKNELEEYMKNKEDESAIEEKVDPEEQKKLASRRAIAERLKREIIDKN